MAINTFKFMTLENLTTYHGALTSWVDGQIGNAVASSIKTVSISKDDATGVSTMHFYTVEAPVGEAQAAFSIPLPHDYYTTEQVDEFIAAVNESIEALSDKVAVDRLADGETVMGRVEVAEGDIVDLKAIVSALTGEEDGEIGSITDAIDDAIAALDLPNTYEAKGTAAEEAGKVQEALDAYIESNNEAVDGKADKATTLAGYGITDAMTADAIAAAIKVETDRAVAKEGEIVASVGAVDEKVDGVAGDLAEYETANDARVKAIEDDYLKAADKTALEAKDAELAGAIAAEKARLDAFMAVGEGESLNDALDTLKELQDYITSEASAADEIVTKVGKLEAIVDGIGDTEAGEKATVVAYVTDAIAALQIGDYAKAEDLVKAVERIATNEKAISDMDAAYKAADAKVVEDMTALVAAEEERALAAEAKAQADAEAKSAELDAALKGELEGKIAEVDGKFVNYSTTTQMNDAIKVETDRAVAAEEALSGRVDALEAVTHDVAAIDEADITALFA